MAELRSQHHVLTQGMPAAVSGILAGPHSRDKIPLELPPAILHLTLLALPFTVGAPQGPAPLPPPPKAIGHGGHKERHRQKDGCHTGQLWSLLLGWQRGLCNSILWWPCHHLNVKRGPRKHSLGKSQATAVAALSCCAAGPVHGGNRPSSPKQPVEASVPHLTRLLRCTVWFISWWWWQGHLEEFV